MFLADLCLKISFFNVIYKPTAMLTASSAAALLQTFLVNTHPFRGCHGARCIRLWSWVSRAVLTFVHQSLRWLCLLVNSALPPFALSVTLLMCEELSISWQGLKVVEDMLSFNILDSRNLKLYQESETNFECEVLWPKTTTSIISVSLVQKHISELHWWEMFRMNQTTYAIRPPV